MAFSSKALEEFLLTIRGSEVEGRVNRALHILSQREVFTPDDLEGADIKTIVGNQAISAGLESFLVKAIRQANTLEVPAAQEAPHSSSADDCLLAIQALGLKTEKEKTVVHVDIARKVTGLTLERVAQPQWPKSDATDDLATKHAKLVKKGIAHPFVMVDLKSFLPPWAEVKNSDEKDDDDDEMNSVERLCSVFHSCAPCALCV